MSCINLYSWNVRGLRDVKKRKALYQVLNEKNIDICLVQETFLTAELEKEIGFEWKGVVIHNYGSNHLKGVSVFIKDNNKVKIDTLFKDNEGRFILLNLNIDNEIFTVVNIYAPNDEISRCTFFRKVWDYIHCHALNQNRLLLGGDFNYVQDIKLDVKVTGLRHRITDRSTDNFKKLCKSFKVKDVWRVKNPLLKAYTCRTKSRIDYFLLGDSLCRNTAKIEIIPSPLYSDHNVVFLELNVCMQKRGPGLWKLNCSLLGKHDYIQGIKSLIATHVKENNSLNPQQKWEWLKIKLREYSMKYGTMNKAYGDSSRKMLEIKLKHIEDELCKKDDEGLV